jgi:hypothetical protein
MNSIFFDGAFGTYLQPADRSRRLLRMGKPKRPEDSFKIIENTSRRGPPPSKTNTFGANSLLCGDDAKLSDLIGRGYALSPEAAFEGNRRAGVCDNRRGEPSPEEEAEDTLK